MAQNQEKKISRLTEAVHLSDCRLECSGIDGSAGAYLVSEITRSAGVPVVVLTADSREAERVLNDLEFYRGETREPAAELFPAYHILPFKPLSYHNRTAAARIRLLYRMSQGEMPAVMVLSLEGLLQRLIPKTVLCDFAEIIMAGEAIDLPALTEKLIAGGYARSAIVEEPGDFCLRGGILDVFSPMYPEPVRLELFGDMIDTMWFFSPVSQRRTTPVDEAILLPAREAILPRGNTGRFIAAVQKQAAELDLPVSVSRDLIDRVTEGINCEGMEGLMPLLYEQLSSFFDYLPANACFVMAAPDIIAEAAVDHRRMISDNYLSSRDEKKMCVPPETSFLDWEEARRIMYGYRLVIFRMLPGQEDSICSDRPADHLRLDIRTVTGLPVSLKYNPDRDRPLKPLAEWIAGNRAEGQTTVIVCGSRSRADRLQEMLFSYDIQPVLAGTFSDMLTADPGSIGLVTGQVSSGFISPDCGLSLICESDVFAGGRRRRSVRHPDVRSEILELEELKEGDLVVHADHGIGRYEGIRKIRVEKVEGDFLLIRYRDEDCLYLSVDRMDMARKYIGVDDAVPELDKMGGKSWQKAKAKARKEAEKIARELLELYARRKVNPGFSFSAADTYFEDFESRFPYEETEDQLKVIEEVLTDMESGKPMDRLVCGDVGFGKTEIAMRAAFKAVCDGKQVAVLVPTTVLAEQHRETFSTRFTDYPVRIACLNRFRSAAEQKQIVREISEGKIDIVIGTHRLLSNDVVFRDIGLVVLDEEQRFGVKHKEKLKTMRNTVDVLSLTATPIPRTLHMSLIGVRDISVIKTPPEDRLAVKTYVSEFDDGIIKAAVRRELKRGGQIYFVHNNINKLVYIADHLQKLVPEVRIGVAHGRMASDKLEKEMLRFVNREIDMLVCTRIIESGLDIPAANTIFVNRADRFGLAQIYQLRGRVGRSDEQAYAYLFIPRDSALSRDARKRLKVLMEHSDLGSGFQIALSDLQIRGGGSVLGVSQSGHIAAVGYDMFLQLMENTVAELKGEPVAEAVNPEINIPLSAYISDEYIPDIDQRMSIYRRLARSRTAADITEVKEELIDRYGKLPAETENLLLKILLKVFAVSANVRKLDLTDTHLCLQFGPDRLEEQQNAEAVLAQKKLLFETVSGQTVRVALSEKRPRQGIVFARNLLKDITLRVNNK
ncbi:MAG: transcription-repair coupling factor [Thermodesulfobacteriota bacterium]